MGHKFSLQSLLDYSVIIDSISAKVAMQELHHYQRPGIVSGRQNRTRSAHISATATTRAPQKPELISEQLHEILLQQIVNSRTRTTLSERDDQASTSSSFHEDDLQQSGLLVSTGRRLRKRPSRRAINLAEVTASPQRRAAYGLTQEEEQTYCHILQVRS